MYSSGGVVLGFEGTSQAKRRTSCASVEFRVQSSRFRV